MNLRMGIDLVSLPRIKTAAGRKRFLERVLGKEERQSVGNSILKLGICFALKEAAWKALPGSSQKKTYFHDIKITWQKKKPCVFLRYWKGQVETSWTMVGDDILAIVILKQNG